MLRRIVLCGAFAALSACAAPPPPADNPDGVARLTAEIQALGPDIDPAEAQRAAQIAYDHTRELAVAYQITDHPLVHNTKVNLGSKPRGLCWHWAEDMEKRLNQEEFRTLQMHRAVANADNVFLLEHSTAIVSRKGDDFDQGIVLDPWRKGGHLTWVPVTEDPKYTWHPRIEVAARKLERRHGQVVTLTDDQRLLVGGLEYALE